MFVSLPVIRVSSARTSHPSARNRSHQCDPRNPAPPVTTALIPPPCRSKNRKFSLLREPLANAILPFAPAGRRGLARNLTTFHFAAYNFSIQMIFATILPNAVARKPRLWLSIIGSLLFLLLLPLLDLGRWLDKEHPPQKTAPLAVLHCPIPFPAPPAPPLFHPRYAPQ